jgi:BlaI family transcriptional regulator, penicillinase repressor
MSTKFIKPTESELEILSGLWQKKTASVREVHEALAETNDKEVGYTTTLKLMQIMHEKGLVKRNQASRTHLYQSAVNQQHTQKKILNKMIDGLFGGSTSELVLQALGNYKATEAEMEAIQELLNKMKK